MSYCYLIQIIEKAIDFSFFDDSPTVFQKHIQHSIQDLYPTQFSLFHEFLQKQLEDDSIYSNDFEHIKPIYIHSMIISNYLGYGRGSTEAIHYLIDFDKWYNLILVKQ